MNDMGEQPRPDQAELNLDPNVIQSQEAHDVLDEMNQLLQAPGWKRISDIIEAKIRELDSIIDKPLSDSVGVYKQEYAKGARAAYRSIMKMPTVLQENMRDVVEALARLSPNKEGE